ncbi:uncharacterized protein NEMAJ01_1205 [Nematocida major]|uniref:uncharacterized protein n=1 Tax=Nematocida major TaxID=1912982 RepID=UPI00200825F1|nr:uncharacterized protein NEMAJ01_1205 [Nematocida major]KAH9386309.1 hypothetical protein NEMAJ01_1205 [Nematocida major]
MMQLNRINEAADILNERAFLPNKDPAKLTTLFKRTITLFLFCLMFLINIGLLLYWASYANGSMSEIYRFLERLELPRLLDAMKSGQKLTMFVLLEGALYMYVSGTLAFMQLLYTRRIIIAKTVGKVILLSFATLVGMLAFFFGICMFLDEMEFERRLLLSTIGGVLSFVIGWATREKIVHFFVPVKSSVLLLDTPYIVSQRPNVDEDGNNQENEYQSVYESEIQKYSSNRQETAGKNGRVAQTKLSKFTDLVKQRGVSAERIKYIMPFVLAAWAILVTFPFSGIVFFLDSSIIDWFVDAFTNISIRMGGISVGEYAIITASALGVAHAYAAFVQICSFFLGSIVGEIRCGKSLSQAFLDSMVKTLLESIEIAVESFYRVASSMAAFLSSILIKMMAAVGVAVFKRKPIHLLAPIWEGVCSITFVFFGFITGISNSFMYFKLGMYPLEYLRTGNREAFFSSQKTMSTSLYATLVFFATLSLAIVVAFVIMHMIDRVNKRLGTETQMLEKPVMGKPLRTWAITLQTTVTVCIVFTLAIIYSFVARHDFAIDMAIDDIIRHAPA